MPQTSLPPATSSTPLQNPRNAGAIWTLLLLAPFIAEVLSGSTRLSFIFVFVPEVMVWGCGALLCRELVRRWRAGAVSLLLLGLALSIAEEFVIQQTSLAPLPFPGANAAYGRLWGVNWVYFLFMLGFESVWVVLVPVQVTELFFPQRRDQPWLRKRGLLATCVIFLVGCRIAWYGWTQQALKRLNAPAYRVPLSAIAFGIGAILLLIGLAWLFRTVGRAASSSSVQSMPVRSISVWIGAIAAFIFGGTWFMLIGFVFAPHPPTQAWISVASGVAWALLGLMLFTRFAAQANWSDTHRWALCFGAALGCMVPSDISSAGWTRLDLIAKYVFQLIALLGFLLLGSRVRGTKPRA